MADRQASIHDALVNVDKELAKYVPPKNRAAAVEPSPDMLTATDATAERIMKGVEEVEKQTKRLRERAEVCITKLKEWANQYEQERAQLLQLQNDLDSTVNAITESITQIGQRLTNSKGEGT